MPDRISYQKKFLIALVFLHELGISSFHRTGLQMIDVFLRDIFFFLVLFFIKSLHRPKHASCSGNAYIRQFNSRLPLQFLLDRKDGGRNLCNIMNLPVQHGSGFMQFHLLRHDMELVFLLISNGADHTSGTDIQTEHHLFLFLASCNQVLSPNFSSTWRQASANVPPFSITTSACAKKVSSGNWLAKMPFIRPSL